MFPDILLLENTFIQFYFSLCASTQSFFENKVKYLPCLTTESNLKPDKCHFYSQTIFSFNLAGMQATDRARGLSSTAYNNTLFWTEVRSKTRYYCTLITSADKITRHLADTVNFPLRFNQSRTRIKRTSHDTDRLSHEKKTIPRDSDSCRRNIMYKIYLFKAKNHRFLGHLCVYCYIVSVTDYYVPDVYLRVFAR